MKSDSIKQILFYDAKSDLKAAAQLDFDSACVKKYNEPYLRGWWELDGVSGNSII